MAYKFPTSVRHHYERLARFPEGYLVCGDALCSFNPVYAQGMSVAALEALTLGQCLHEQARARSLTGLSHRFFTHAATVINIPWAMATGADFNYLEVPGKRSLRTHFINWYIGKIHKAARARPGCVPGLFRGGQPVATAAEPVPSENHDARHQENLLG